MNLFGLRLKTLRNGKKITQRQLADKIGVSKALVSKYELSAIYPSVEVLIKLCNYFSVSADYLLGLSDKIDFKVSHLKDEQVMLVVGTINQFEKLNEIENPAE